MTLLAIAVALLGFLATASWFGVSRRRKEEAELGVQALATMKWRDCVALVLEALQRDGYPRAPDEVDEAGATEFMLEHEGERVLLGYKHGTAYRLGEANVREFASALRMRGARSGVLCTLGTLEPGALVAAEQSRVQLFDGAALWRKLRPLVPAPMLQDVRHDAVGRTRYGLWFGLGGSLLAGLLLFGAGRLIGAAPEAVATPAGNGAGGNVPAVAPGGPGAPGTAVASSAPASDQAMLRQLQDSARLMEEVARLTPEQKAQRRAETAKQVGRLAPVGGAMWSAQRTLLVHLDQTDGKDKALVDDICRIVTQHEELRFTRVQLEPPAGSTQAVRWRLCE
jgi:hypothetical protein